MICISFKGNSVPCTLMHSWKWILSLFEITTIGLRKNSKKDLNYHNDNKPLPLRCHLATNVNDSSSQIFECVRWRAPIKEKDFFSVTINNSLKDFRRVTDEALSHVSPSNILKNFHSTNCCKISALSLWYVMNWMMTFYS